MNNDIEANRLSSCLNRYCGEYDSGLVSIMIDCRRDDKEYIKKNTLEKSGKDRGRVLIFDDYIKVRKGDWLNTGEHGVIRWSPIRK